MKRKRGRPPKIRPEENIMTEPAESATVSPAPAEPDNWEFLRRFGEAREKANRAQISVGQFAEAAQITFDDARLEMEANAGLLTSMGGLYWLNYNGQMQWSEMRNATS